MRNLIPKVPPSIERPGSLPEITEWLTENTWHYPALADPAPRITKSPRNATSPERHRRSYAVLILLRRVDHGRMLLTPCGDAGAGAMSHRARHTGPTNHEEGGQEECVSCASPSWIYICLVRDGLLCKPSSMAAPDPGNSYTDSPAHARRCRWAEISVCQAAEHPEQPAKPLNRKKRLIITPLSVSPIPWLPHVCRCVIPFLGAGHMRSMWLL